MTEATERPLLGRQARERMQDELGDLAHVKVVYDNERARQRYVVYCVACRSASMVSYDSHQIIELWDDHFRSPRHARKSEVHRARIANHEGLFPE